MRAGETSGSAWLRFLAGLVVVIGMGSGCIDAKYLVLLQADGSGTISYHCEVSEQGVAQFTETIGLLSTMRLVDEAEIAASLGLRSEELTPDSIRQLYTRANVARMAGSLGDGVELLRYQAVSERGTQGFRALYRFADIHRLRLGPDWRYRFLYKRGATSSLRLVPPSKLAGYSEVATASTLDPVIDGLRRMPNADGFVNHLFSDGHVQLAVQVPGTVVQSTRPLSGGNTVILADVDADAVPGGSTILEVLSVKEPLDLLALYQAEIPGVTLVHPAKGMEVRFQ